MEKQKHVKCERKKTNKERLKHAKGERERDR